MQVIKQIHELKNLIEDLKKSKVIALDTETNSLDVFTCKLYMVQIATESEVYVLDFTKLPKKLLEYLVELLNVLDIQVVGHNVKYDLKVIKTHSGLWIKRAFDLMVTEKVLNNGIGKKFYSLDDLVLDYYAISLDKTVRATFYETDNITDLTDEQLTYGAKDVEYILGIRNSQIEKAVFNNLEKTVELETNIVPLVAKMEYLGIRLDVEKWKGLLGGTEDELKVEEANLKQKLLSAIDYSKLEGMTMMEIFKSLCITTPKTKKFKTEMDALHIEMLPMTEQSIEYIKSELLKLLNINSSMQIKGILNNLGADLESAGEKILIEIVEDYPIVNDIIKYREFAKKVEAFGNNYITAVHPITGSIHSTCNQAKADTGRMSFSNPALQQVLRDSEYRACFIPRPGKKFICADYKQQELRCAGAGTGEQKFIEAYKKDIDMHQLTASIVYETLLESVTKAQRQIAKSMNFAILYGSTPMGFSYNFGIPEKEAKLLIDRFYNGYKTLAEFKKRYEDLALERGYAVTMYGRKRYLNKPSMFSDWKEARNWERKARAKAFNTYIQGTCADITKLAAYMIEKNNPFGDKLNIILIVHDELDIEVDEDIVKEAEAYILKWMLWAEDLFFGDLPSGVDIAISDCWKH